ncbi:hypothetical protein EDB80DRAFT_595087 [Ilyonectria destructans]|nr:hypothetical protein EDB80DRAFT_595804 [Ilyonectria destructans]KAH6974898.1 hypothetical protein EDB80DRAFT_595087 [Ilyonectria destructans]
MPSSTSTSNSTSTSTLSGHPPPRMPYDSQKNLGSDMTMSFFGQLDTPTRFPTSDEQLIKSLNVEALGRVFLPPPPYMTLPEYSVLRPEGYRSPDPLPIYFSLNLSVYNQQIVESEWENQWFHFTGKVHPYALEWVLREPDVFTDEDGDGEVYKCCTYITPGQPSKSPFKGFHPFQVFILFPIRALPFSLLCKKMADRKDTQFVPGVPFNCVGKIVGLLDHSLMVAAPTVDEKDYVFIVVPDSWTFPDKSTPPAPAANTVSPSKTEPGPSQAGGFAAARSMFKSPSKKSSQAQQSRSQSSQSPQGGPSQQPVTPSQNKRPAISASPSSQSSSKNPAPKRLRGSTVTTATSPIIAGSPVSPLTSVDSDENDNHEEGEAKENEDSRSPNISATLRSSVRPNMRSSTTKPGGRNKRHPTKRL